MSLIASTAAPAFPQALRARLGALALPEPLRPRSLAAAAEALTLRQARAREGAESLHHRLLLRTTMGPTLADLQRIEELGYRGFLETELDADRRDDEPLEDVLAQVLPTLTLSPGELLFRFHEEREVPLFELVVATVLRSIYSPRQLLERLVVFWSDHFHTHFLADFGVFLKATDHREVVRRHALGTFPDMLRASAHSPAMLDYLTNDSNVRGHANENYARELMELHTLGVDGGYTQDDVREVSRAFTGWTFHPPRDGLAFGRFVFVPSRHDPGPKTVLGQALPGGGQADGEAVLDLLAAHPATARFLAGKLLRYFWGYEPRDEDIEEVAETYLETGGEIPAMLRAILAWPRLAAAPGKLKRPYHLAVSTARALFAPPENLGLLIETILAAGHLPYLWDSPDGYPDSAEYWSDFVLPRWNLAAQAPAPGPGGLSADLSSLDLDLPVPALVSLLGRIVLGGAPSDSTRREVERFLSARPVTEARARDAVGLLLASPDFQSY
jgi:hypothetical protein